MEQKETIMSEATLSVARRKLQGGFFTQKFERCVLSRAERSERSRRCQANTLSNYIYSKGLLPALRTAGEAEAAFPWTSQPLRLAELTYTNTSQP